MRSEDLALYNKLMLERYGPLERLEQERTATPSSEPLMKPATSLQNRTRHTSTMRSTGARSVESSTSRHRDQPESVPIPNPEESSDRREATASG